MMSSSSSWPSIAIAPSPSYVNTEDASQPTTGQNIANWSIGNKQVAVFQKNDNLSYSLTEGSQVETGNISLALYDSPPARNWALALITIFKQVLLSDGVKPSFLPTFFTLHERPSPAPKLLLALFAQMKRTEWGKEIVQAKWGIGEIDKNNDKITWIEVTDQETKDFLTGAPMYRKEMDEYYQHFKEVVTLDANHRVQAIAMRCVSALNRDIFLDENTWAVTLISAQKSAGGGIWLNTGHGSIAWEGVEAGSYFLKWADITTVYENRQPGEARIRIENRTFPSTNWMLGPTCSRPKDLVNRMVEYISRDLTVLDGSTWSSKVQFSFLASFSNMFKSAMDIEKERRKLGAIESCLSFAITSLRRAKIFLPEPGKAEPNSIPHAYVMSVRSNYLPVIDNDSRIVFMHKEARHIANKAVQAQILVSLFTDIMDVLETATPANASSLDDDG